MNRSFPPGVGSFFSRRMPSANRPPTKVIPALPSSSQIKPHLLCALPACRARAVPVRRVHSSRDHSRPFSGIPIFQYIPRGQVFRQDGASVGKVRPLQLTRVAAGNSWKLRGQRKARETRWRNGCWNTPIARMPSTKTARTVLVRRSTGMGEVVRGASKYIRFTIMR